MQNEIKQKRKINENKNIKYDIRAEEKLLSKT